MLNKELSHFAENNKSGAQISDYLYSTYTGKKKRMKFFIKEKICFVFNHRQKRTRC
jgi:hypothetical protein